MFRREPEPTLFPSSLESSVGPLVVRLRLVAEEVAGSRLRELYKPQGGVPYDPVGLFCVLIYGLMRRTSSSRELEDRVRYDVRFQYLMGSQTPDHTTINRFRRLLGDALEEIALAVLAKARAEGLISGKNVAVDGTKIEANTSQWRKMVKEADEEDAHADPDAKLMRHRRTGILRGFNAQVVVDMDGEGFVLASKVSSAAKESDELAEILEELEETVGLPEALAADAGYDSAPNLKALADKSVTSFVSPHAKYDLFWSASDGVLRCPAGHIPVYQGEHLNNGVLYTTYRVRQCGGCPLRSACDLKLKANKRVTARAGFDPAVRVANAHRSATPQGGEMRRRRSATVERVFAQLRSNRGLNRFKLRGRVGASLEFRLHCLAYNLEKLLGALFRLLKAIFRLRLQFRVA